MHYYMDESGNTGDLINRKNDFNFANQQVFSHSCIGLNEDQFVKLNLFIIALKTIFDIDKETELKCEDYYLKNPELIFCIIKFLVDNEIPILCEVADKKHNLSIAMSYIIIPSNDAYKSEYVDFIRRELSNLITEHAPDRCFEDFFTLCKNQDEKSLISVIEGLKLFFKKMNADNGVNENTVKILNMTLGMLNMTLDDYYSNKELFPSENVVKQFIPYPDLDSHGNVVKMLPNVYSFYNIIARLNNLHNKDFKKIKVYHDITSEYAETLKFCTKNIVSADLKNKPHVANSDYKVKDYLNVVFIDSKNSIGVQVADIVAGFLTRYLRGVIYKKIEPKLIYDQMFDLLMHYNRTNNSMGTNFVFPDFIRRPLFVKFGL